MTAVAAESVLVDLATAARLRPDEIDGEDTIFDLGIDSVRLMALVERWREQGADVDFADLARNPTVIETQALLAAR